MLTIRECARLQGFPDYFQFCGTVKERLLIYFVFSLGQKTEKQETNLTH